MDGNMKPNNHNDCDERWARECAEITFALVLTVLFAFIIAQLHNDFTGSDDAEVAAQHEQFSHNLLERGY
jgi:hypothetical protein